MSDLTARLRAAINHRMGLAKAAAPYWNHMYVGMSLEAVLVSDADYIEFVDAVRQHTDANDPARIIRDCEAHLRILSYHKRASDDTCEGCWTGMPHPDSRLPWPCLNVLAIAHIYPDDLDQAADQPRPAATT